MDKTQLIDFLVDNMSDYRLLKHILQLANIKRQSRFIFKNNLIFYSENLHCLFSKRKDT